MYWWLSMAVIPSMLYAMCNHIDKHLLEEHFEGNLGVPALVLISALVSVVAIPFILWGSPTSVIPDDLTHIFVFMVVGFLHTALLWFYLLALNEEDTTTIIIFYSVLPILGMLSSNIILGETLLPMQLVAMAVIIFGILIVSFEKGEDGYRFKFKAAGLMVVASLCWALGDVVFKFVAIEENIWRALFWEHLILFFVGVVMFSFAPNIRKQLGQIMKNNSRRIISINLANEVLYIVANVMSAFPLMMVQVAAVHLVQSFQPVWVFLIALFLWWKGTSSEVMGRWQIVQKSIATVIAVYGMYLLAIYTPS